MSWKEEEEREKNAIYSGHLRLCQQPRAAHALRSDQYKDNQKLKQLGPCPWNTNITLPWNLLMTTPKKTEVDTAC